MTTPAGPTDPASGSNPFEGISSQDQSTAADLYKNQPGTWGAGAMPVSKPLSPNDPWVNITANFFGCSKEQAMIYGGRFKDNMFQYLQDEIKRDNERRKHEQQIEKELRGY